MGCDWRRLTSLRHVVTIESIGSSTRIEGSRLTDREVDQLLADIATRDLTSCDEQEVAGYADVMDIIFASFSDVPFNENYIKQFHRDLLRSADIDEWHRGGYKQTPNHIGAVDAVGVATIISETASPFDTPRLMDELVRWYNEAEANKSLHPLLLIAIFTTVFLEIHPFQDGNGRLSRILTSWLLLRAGYAYVPYSSLESVVEKNKAGYYRSIGLTQKGIRTSQPQWEPWLLFFLRALQRQKDHLKTKLEREHQIMAQLPALSVQILEIAREQGRITLQDAVTLSGISRNTLKEHFKALTASNRLSLHGRGRGAWYRLAG